MKKLLKVITVVLFTALPSGFSQPVHAQTQSVKVSGTVVDSQGQPLPGVFIVGAGNSNTMTDADGKFSISVPAGSELTASCMSYVSYKFKASAKYGMTITLAEDTQSLDESVVVGYGTQKKAVLTGAVSSISDKSIATTTSNDLVSKLQGKVSGLTSVTIQVLLEVMRPQSTFEVSVRLFSLSTVSTERRPISSVSIPRTSRASRC